MCSKLIRQINGTYLKDDGTNIGNLDMAAQRQLPQDILNVEYAMKNYGYVPPTSQSTSQSTPPAGMVPIPGAQYDTREKQQAVFSNIQPIGNTLYGVPKQQQQQQEQNTPENAPENNPADTFNLLIGNALSKFQGVNTADLEKKKRALQLAASDRISDITPEELRTFSPAQQAAIRSGDVSSLQPEFDEVAYQLNKAQQAAANFENVYEKIVNISGEYAEKMVAPDSVIQNYKQLIEANPDDINTYLAKVNDKTRDAILNVLDYEKMKPKEKIDTQIVTVGGRSLLVNKNTGEVIKDLEVETSQQLIGNVIGDKGIMSSSGNAYDMSTYATDPKHSQSVQRYLDEIGKFNNTSDIDNYIQSKYPNSSITGNIVSNVSSKYGIGWEELVALAQHESLLGTSNVAKSNNNPGGITWNANFPEDMKGTARPGSEGGYYVKFDSMEEGLASVAYELARRKVDISDAESGVFNTKDYDFVRQKVNNNTGAADAAKTVVRDFSEALNLMSSDLFQYQNVASASQRALFKNFPGTIVYEINSLIESAKSNIGIDKLLEIKASGAGLGQVPQSQLETLQSVLGRMDVTRDPVLLRRDIEEAINKYNSVVDRTTNENNELMKQYPQYAEMLNLDVNTDTGEPDISDINLSF